MSMMTLLVAALSASGAAAQGIGGEIAPALPAALNGLVAGEPVPCIDLRAVRSTRITDEGAILFDTGTTIYLNRAEGGLGPTHQYDTLLINLHHPRLCNVDVIDVIQPSTGVTTGTAFLRDFIPYARPRRN